MNWHYAENNQRLGPVDEAAFEALVAQGKITPQTLVWREGMENWQPFSQVRGGAAASEAGPAGGTAACTSCGQTFPTDEMIRYEGRFVCPACKPAFFQKVKEGALVVGDRVFAGFWTRFAAVFIDGIIGQIVGFVIGLMVGSVMSGGDKAQAVAGLLGFVFGVAYEVYFIGSRGATPGKMALKIRVVRADGSPVGYALATGRYFAKILSALILLIGYIMAAFDEEKRALHDRICDTRVVRE